MSRLGEFNQARALRLVALEELPEATVADINALWSALIADYADVWANHLEALQATWELDRRYSTHDPAASSGKSDAD